MGTSLAAAWDVPGPGLTLSPGGAGTGGGARSASPAVRPARDSDRAAQKKPTPRGRNAGWALGSGREKPAKPFC